MEHYKTYLHGLREWKILCAVLSIHFVHKNLAKPLRFSHVVTDTSFTFRASW